MLLDDALHNSAIVIAHPDDEILWFSSIIRRVSTLVICFVEQKSEPGWSEGRKKALAEYPFDNLRVLGLDLADAFDCCNWRNPRITPYGVELRGNRCAKTRYERNYRELTERLKEHLADCSNVFTHNPWGEYGHEEHVQVFRAVDNLRTETGFNVWFSGYCSRRSVPLMLRYVRALDNECIRAATDSAVVNEIRSLYERNGCWSWFGDYQWPEEDRFFRLAVDGHGVHAARILPLNFIDFEPTERSRGVRSASPVSRFLRRARRALLRRCRPSERGATSGRPTFGPPRA